MVFQPIISLATGELYGYEALLRMTQENGTEILPRGFLPAAERFGMIHSVERWSVRYAINYLAQENRRLGSRYRFAINLSGRAFSDEELLPVIESALRDSALDPSLLTFEITETAAITNMTVVSDFVGKLKRLGCQFALDDFGSGFSSFAHLKQLQVDKVKIDGTFIQGLANDSIDHALVKSITSLAHTLGMETMASGVEDERTLELLERHGVDYAQGFYISRPTSDLGQLSLDFLHNGCKLA
jgi:EAL domain-containing protein (putative c-di-GMP-specific phosphodiesterase class I)